MVRWLSVGLMLLILAGIASPALAGIDDPFSGITETVFSQGKFWAAAIMVVGLVYAGGKVALGSQDAGRNVARVMGAALILVFVLKGRDILEFLSTFFGVQ